MTGVGNKLGDLQSYFLWDLVKVLEMEFKLYPHRWRWTGLTRLLLNPETPLCNDRYCLHLFEPGNLNKMCSVLTEVSHLHFYGTWQGWLWQAWLDQRKLVTGVRISGKRSAHERHCDPACCCCYALGPGVCRYRCLHLLLRSRFDQDDHCGGRSRLRHHYPLPRALTLSLCPLNVKQGSAPSFSVE